MFKQIEHMCLIAHVGNGEGMREETDERQRILMKQQEQPFPIGSMYGIYMVTWIPSTYPLYVSIYTSTMDPSWVCGESF